MTVKDQILPSWDNDLYRGSCKYTDTIDRVRWKNDRSYKDCMWLRNNMRDAYGQKFHLTPEQVNNMTFNQAFNYADAIYSERFEGIP